MERLPDPLQPSCPESRICFKAKQVRSVLPRERTKILHLPVTPTEWLPIAEKLLALELGLDLDSAIVTDFAMERLPDSLQLSCPESRICFKVETVTRTERASQGKSKNSSLTGRHTNGVAPHRREAACLGAGS